MIKATIKPFKILAEVASWEVRAFLLMREASTLEEQFKRATGSEAVRLTEAMKSCAARIRALRAEIEGV